MIRARTVFVQSAGPTIRDVLALQLAIGHASPVWGEVPLVTQVVSITQANVLSQAFVAASFGSAIGGHQSGGAHGILVRGLFDVCSEEDVYGTGWETPPLDAGNSGVVLADHLDLALMHVLPGATCLVIP
eukprot:XP_001699739.1 predicted protein [Chlamydomonas reinhardtii]